MGWDAPAIDDRLPTRCTLLRYLLSPHPNLFLQGTEKKQSAEKADAKKQAGKPATTPAGGSKRDRGSAAGKGRDTDFINDESESSGGEEAPEAEAEAEPPKPKADAGGKGRRRRAMALDSDSEGEIFVKKEGVRPDRCGPAPDSAAASRRRPAGARLGPRGRVGETARRSRSAAVRPAAASEAPRDGRDRIHALPRGSAGSLGVASRRLLHVSPCSCAEIARLGLPRPPRGPRSILE